VIVSKVEELLSSQGRVKIVKIMLESNELNISEIIRRSGVSHSAVEPHLEFLVALGLLTEKRFNRIRIFEVNHSNPYTKVLARFLSEWNALSSSHVVERAFN